MFIIVGVGNGLGVPASNGELGECVSSLFSHFSRVTKNEPYRVRMASNLPAFQGIYCNIGPYFLPPFLVIPR